MKWSPKSRIVAGLAAAAALTGVAVPAAQAACYYAKPTTASHVTYYDCKGPFYYNYNTRRWDCYADYDWVAETFYGKKDGRIWVYTGKTCTA